MPFAYYETDDGGEMYERVRDHKCTHCEEDKQDCIYLRICKKTDPMPETFTCPDCHGNGDIEINDRGHTMICVECNGRGFIV